VDISNLTRNLIAPLAGEEIAGGRIRDPADPRRLHSACIQHEPPVAHARLVAAASAKGL